MAVTCQASAMSKHKPPTRASKGDQYAVETQLAKKFDLTKQESTDSPARGKHPFHFNGCHPEGCNSTTKLLVGICISESTGRFKESQITKDSSLPILTCADMTLLSFLKDVHLLMNPCTPPHVPKTTHKWNSSMQPPVDYSTPQSRIGAGRRRYHPTRCGVAGSTFYSGGEVADALR